MLRRVEGRGLGRFGLCAVLVTAAWFCLCPAPAGAAGEKATAKRIYKKGVTEYNLGHLDEAIAQFEKAYELDPSPILLFNIGQAHRKLGHGDRAVFFFRRYLAENPGAKDRQKVEDAIREIEEAAQKERSETPSPVRPPPAAPPAQPGPVIPRTPEPEEPRPAVAPQPSRDPGAEAQGPASWHRPVAWAAAAGAVGALGLGIYETIAYNGHRSDFEAIGSCGEDEPHRGADPRCADAFDGGKSAKTFAIVGFATGAALGGLAAFLFATSADSAGGHATATACTFGATSASCRFSF
jgi:tetratricopeptide (TPR) repeat protein